MIYIHPAIVSNPLRVAQLMENTGLIALIDFKLDGRSIGKLVPHSQPQGDAQ